MRRALTNSRAVLKGIAFVRSSNPFKTLRTRPPKRVYIRNPGCSTRVRGCTRDPSTYQASVAVLNVPVLRRAFGQNLIFSRHGVVPSDTLAPANRIAKL